MKIIGCDLHARQQTLAMLDSNTGEVVKATLQHEGNGVREFYDRLPRPARVGIEATGSMQWFLNLVEELGIECLVGHPATIRAAESRKQKHDRRDADLILTLLAENRFPAIWLPTLDAADMLSTFMVDDWPDPIRFLGGVRGLIQSASASADVERPVVAAFGEMVALLWAEGKTDAAIRLEELWNDVVPTHDVNLLCAYPLGSFATNGDNQPMARMCATHSAVSYL